MLETPNPLRGNCAQVHNRLQRNPNTLTLIDITGTKISTQLNTQNTQTAASPSHMTWRSEYPAITHSTDRDPILNTLRSNIGSWTRTSLIPMPRLSERFKKEIGRPDEKDVYLPGD